MKSMWYLLKVLCLLEIIVTSEQCGESIYKVQESAAKTGSLEGSAEDIIKRAYTAAIETASREKKRIVENTLAKTIKPQLAIEIKRQPYEKIAECLQHFQKELEYIVQNGQNNLYYNFEHFKNAKLACMQKGTTVDVQPNPEDREICRRRVRETLSLAFTEAKKDEVFPAGFKFYGEDAFIDEVIKEASQKQFLAIEGCLEITKIEIAEIVNKAKDKLKSCQEDQECIKTATDFPSGTLLFTTLKCIKFDPEKQIPNDASPNYEDSIEKTKAVALKYVHTADVVTDTELKEKLKYLIEQTNKNGLIEEAGETLYYNSVSDCLKNDEIVQLVNSVQQKFNNCISSKLKPECISSTTSDSQIALNMIISTKKLCMTYKGF